MSFDTSAPDKKRTWAELVTIAHRHIHQLPPDMEPGLSVSHIMPVPTGGGLPTADGRVQMYPCYSFEFHLDAGDASIPTSASRRSSATSSATTAAR